MSLLHAMGWALGYAAAAYLVDVPIRRGMAARAALAYARKVGKPLLNIGAGTKSSALFGSHVIPDAINVDVCAGPVPHNAAGKVSTADAQDLSDFRTGQFGAVLASHVLEHLPDPKKALSEWLRVVGGDRSALFIVVPSWWAPHTWLHPGHLWYFSSPTAEPKALRKPSSTLPPCSMF